MLKQTLILIAIISLIACGSVSIHKYKAHNDTSSNPAELSVLHVARDIYVNEIDSKGKYSPDQNSSLSSYSGAEIELSPGKHSLSMEFKSSAFRSEKATIITHDFQSGKHYFLHEKIDSLNNVNSGTTLSGTTTGLSFAISYIIDSCGSPEEAAYNKYEKKHEHWLRPYVPACSLTS